MSSVRRSVVHISSAHPWTDNRVHYRECVTLAEADFDVTLVAVESDVEGSRSDVRIVTLPRLPRARRVFISTIRAVRAGFRTGADIVHLHDPELIWAIPVFRLAGKQVIFDAHEDLPDQMAGKPYLRGPARKIGIAAAHLAVAAAKLSNHVVAATPKIAERFPSRKTTIVRNYPPLRIVEEAAQPPDNRRLAVAYIGAITSDRGADVMIAAVARAEFPQGWVFELAGKMSDHVYRELRNRPGWGRTNFHGQLPPLQARDILMSVRVGLVLLQRTEAYLNSLPTKMFEYFAAGIPVIASDFPLWRSIVQQHDCGLVVDETSPKAIAEAVRLYAEDIDLYRQHAFNARRLAVTEFNWASEGSALVAAYGSLNSP